MNATNKDNSNDGGSSKLFVFLIVLFLTPHFLWAQEFEISGVKQITSNGYHPRWSPDGSKIVYTVRTAEVVELWIYEVESKNSYAAVQEMNGDLTPSWSPDSRKIAFDAYESPNSHKHQIWIKDLQTGDLYQFTKFSFNCVAPAWSKDGSRIAFRGDNSIKVKEVQSGVLSSIPNTNNGSCPDWKHDGTQLAFTIGPEDVNDIYIMNIDGTLRKKITDYSGRDDRPQWSPNGKIIAYEVFDNGPKIYLYFIRSGKSYCIMEANYGGFPSWSPDGQKIVFALKTGIHILNFKESSPTGE